MARRIKTTLGNDTLNPDDDIWVYVDGRIPVKKKVSELGKGDRIRFRRNKIEVTLDQALQHLESNPFYKHARGRIFYRYISEEDKVTMLRKLLLEGLVSQEVFPDTDEFRKSIVREGSDLTPTQYSAAYDAITSLFKGQGRAPAAGTLREWLRSETVLPYHPFKEVIPRVNPELEDFVDENGPRHKAWAFWMACRQQVMRRLMHGKGNGNGKGNHTPLTESLEKKDTVGVIVDDIVDQIAEEYDSDTVIATVTGVGEGRIQDRRDSVVEKGNESPIMIDQLIRDSKIVHSYAIPVMAEYLHRRRVQLEDFGLIEEEVLARMVESTGGSFQKSLYKRMKTDRKMDPEVVNRVMDDLIQNIPDRVVGIPEGTLRRLLSLEARLFSRVPDELVDYKLSKGEYITWGKNETVGRMALESKRRRIFTKYGFDPDAAFYGKEALWTIFDLCDQTIFKGNLSEAELKARAEELAGRYGGKSAVFSRKEILETLKRYGLQSLVDMNPWNFVLDDSAAAGEVSEAKHRGDIAREYLPDENFFRNATRQHNDLVQALVLHPEMIVEGARVIGSEYRFEEGWARADVVYELIHEGQRAVLALEVKQNAVPNGNGFDNAAKAVEQTAGYRAALESKLAYQRAYLKNRGCLKPERKGKRCPLFDYLSVQGVSCEIPVMGALAAYEISPEANEALKVAGCFPVRVTKAEDNSGGVGK